MARNKKGIKVTNSNGTTIFQTDKDMVVRRKPKKGETIHTGENVVIQNNGIGSQTIVNLDTVSGDWYL